MQELWIENPAEGNGVTQPGFKDMCPNSQQEVEFAKEDTDYLNHTHDDGRGGQCRLRASVVELSKENPEEVHRNTRSTTQEPNNPKTQRQPNHPRTQQTSMFTTQQFKKPTTQQHDNTTTKIPKMQSLLPPEKHKQNNYQKDSKPKPRGPKMKPNIRKSMPESEKVRCIAQCR